MTDATVVLDRRQRRRQESLDEILDVALDLMAEQGVAGLSLGEVARRLGVRPPSLYGYFPSKHALYDAEFARGASALLNTIRTATQQALAADSIDAALLTAATVFIQWTMEHPVYSQLLFWRTVPGFEPSAEAYAPAVELIELTSATFAEFQNRGWLRDDVAVEEIVRDWTIVSGGIVSQQLANAPSESFATGRFTAALPRIVSMFVAEYATKQSTTQTSTTRKGAQRVRKSR